VEQDERGAGAAKVGCIGGEEKESGGEEVGRGGESLGG